MNFGEFIFHFHWNSHTWQILVSFLTSAKYLKFHNPYLHLVPNTNCKFHEILVYELNQKTYCDWVQKLLIIKILV